MLTGGYLLTASFTHRRGQILSKIFYRQIEHKDCDQVKEKCLTLMNFYSPILVTPNPSRPILANPSLPSAKRLTDFNLEKNTVILLISAKCNEFILYLHSFY